MNKSFKKMFALILAVILTMSLVACGKKEEAKDTGAKAETETEAVAEETAKTEEAADASQGEPITLNVWHQWSNDTNQLKKLYEEAAEAYMAENPNITINTQTLDTEAYKTKISAEFAGEASGIDVFYYWGAGAAKKLIDADKILPIDEYLTDDIKAKIMPGSTSSFEFNGKTYSVPSFSWYMTLFANKDLFDKAGAKLPTTYDELVDAVEKLKTLDGVIPIAAGAKDPWCAAFVYQALALREVGAEKINAMLSGEAGFDDPGYAEAAKKVVELYEMGAFGKSPLESVNDDSNAAIGTGTAAMRINGSWVANGIYTDETYTINPDDVVALPIPMISGKGNETDYCGGFVESFWVNKSTKYQKEAVDFMLYINEQMGKAAYETGSGFCAWDVELDDSNLNPLFIQVKDLLADDVSGVLAWDTSLDANAAAVHNEQVQTLFAPNADIDTFIEEHQAILNK